MGWVCLVVGSVAGGAARYLLSGAVFRAAGSDFPYGTFAVNLLGCLAVGVVDGALQRGWRLEHEARLLLMTGFCGAFTTFSTLMLETEHLLRHGHWLRAAGNVGGSAVLGFVLLRVGLALGRAFP